MREDRKDPDFYPPMPPLEIGEHLLDFLFEVGPSMGGEEPLTHAEIESWQKNCGFELQPWEARFLRRLSIDYLQELRLAEKPDSEPAWDGILGNASAANLSAVAERMKAGVRALAGL